MAASSEPNKRARIVYRDRWNVVYEIKGGRMLNPPVPLDPNCPAALEHERILKLMVEHETHPQLLESAKRGLKTIEERRRKLKSNESET